MTFLLKRKSRRADITITILVIGVFVLCSLAIASFYYSGAFVRNPSDGLDVVEKMNSQIEKYNAPAIVKGNFKILDVQTDEHKNKFFYIEETDDDEVVFYVKYYFKN